MVSLRVRLIAAVVLVAAVAAAAIVAAVPGARSAVAVAGLELALRQRGFVLRHVDLQIAGDDVDARAVVIDDASGAPVFMADRIHARIGPGAWLGRSDRRFGLESLEIDRPVLHLVRAEDGSYNISSLLGAPGAQAPASGAGPPAPPLRADVRIAGATLDVSDPSAPAKPGRFFAVEAIDFSGRIDQGAVTKLGVKGTYIGGAMRTPLRAAIFEDDATRFALATLTAGPIAVAPIFDGLVPTTAFSIEDGIVRDARVQAFSVGYEPAAGPAWSLSGSGTLSHGRFRVVPLIVPVHDVSGPLAFAGGRLAWPALSGTLTGSPIVIRGGVRLLGGVLLGVSAHARESLGSFKHAFAFSQRLDVSGPVDVDVRIAGPPDDPNVAAAYRSAAPLAYTRMQVSALSGTLFYSQGHITLPEVDGAYDGGTATLHGDIDMSSATTAGVFDIIASMPGERLPVIANANPGGLARAIAMLDGPIEALHGVGYADVVGGNGTVARTAFEAGLQRFAVGPALVDDAGGGEMLVSGGIDRSTSPHSVSGEIIARGASMHLIDGIRSLPGIDDAAPIALPATDGRMSGTILVRGDEGAPATSIDARADGLTVAGVRLGHAVIVAAGRNGRIRIARATIAGPDVDARVSGFAAVSPRAGRYAAALAGDGAADLARLGAASSAAHLQGRASGRFTAALSGGHWTVVLNATSGDARIAGVRAQSVTATLGGGGGGATDIYASSLQTAGGVVSAMGTAPTAARGGGDLKVWSDDLDLSVLAPAKNGDKGGHAVAMARVGGSMAAPSVAGAVALRNARAGGQTVGGDVDLQYRGDRLTASGGRVLFGGNFAGISGTVSGLRPGAPAGAATLALDASMREGDLGALAGRYMPKSVDVRGDVAGTLHVGGSIASPRIAGDVDADAGTIQGVAFDHLRGSIAASNGRLSIDGGAVGIGSSTFAFAGDLSPAVVHIRASSPHVDLADFNDFFAGYDTLEGKGRGSVAFESTRDGLIGSGSVSLAGASVQGFPLGTVDADFASGRDRLLAHLRQTGDAGSSDLHGSLTFAPRSSALPDLKTARYDLRGSVRGADLGRIMPLLGRENLGVSGFVDLDGTLHGDMRAPSGRAIVNVRDGHVGKVAITSANGTIDTDGSVIAIRDASATLPFAHIDGGGTIGPGRRIAASAGIDASDLGTLVALVGQPGIAAGSALGSVNVSGTLAAPHVAAAIASGRGSLFGVGFDRLAGKVAYQPGEVDIADANADLSGGRGTIQIGGTLPLRLAPFGLGPKEKRVDLSLFAKAVDLSALDPLTSGQAALTGRLDANGKLSGTAGQPQVSGSLTVRDAGVLSPYDTIPAEHLNADLAFAKDTLTLSRLTADLGRGTIRGSGAVHIVPAVGLLSVAGLQYWTRLDLNGAQIDVPGWTTGTLDGDLRLTKSGSVPFLTGDVTLDDGTVPFAAIYRLASGYGGGASTPEAGPIPGVPELRPGHIIVYGGSVFGEGGPYTLGAPAGATPAPAGPQLPQVDLSVNARAGRNVRVHGGPIDLTASGGVLVGGDLTAPTLAGTFTSARGQIGYFDTNFRLVRGIVTFDPVEGLLPTLDAQAITNLNGSEITLTVTGRIDNLQTDLSSNPSMSRDEIVATLLHAPQVQSVLGATASQAQTALYAEAQSYFNAQLTRSLLFPVESLLAQSINVEQISLIYDQQGRVDVEVRKLVTPTVYAIYRSSLNIPVTQTAGVAYSLRDYADLEILQTQSSSGLQQTVLNLRLTFH